MVLPGLIVVAAGLFSLAGGALNWTFFMENRKAKRMTALIGYTGARIFYCVLGAVIAIAGALMVFGVIR